MGKSGQITVFLSMILLCMVSLLLGLAESARIAGVRYRFQVALNSSISSIMSQYHRELWDEYQIFLLDQTKEEICEEIKQYMNAYGFETAEIQYKSGVQATDQGAQWVEEEIMDYMKYGIWTMEFDEKEVEEIGKALSGAGELADASERFSSCTKEALRLEKIVRKLADSIEKQNRHGEEVSHGIVAQSKEQISYAVEEYQKENKKIQKNVKEYEKIAAIMREKMKHIKIENEKRKEDMDAEICQIVELEEERYDTYIAVDGERYREIQGMGALSQKNEEILSMVKECALQAEEDPKEDDNTWQDVETSMDGYEKILTVLKKTEGEEEKVNLLENLKEWMEGDILTLLLEDESVISKGKMQGKDLPSGNISERTGKLEKRMLSAIQWNAYIKEYFQDFRSLYIEKEQITGGLETNKDLTYEAEYILSGYSSDRENLRDSVKKILAVRTGLNLLYLYTDNEKRGEADQLAMAIMGSSGLAPFAPVLTFFILSVWSMAEGMVDVKGLLNGEKIPLWKSRDEWKLDLEDMLNMAKQKKWREEKEKENTEGMEYGTYLRLLLLFQDNTEKTYRVLDLMQNKIRKKQTGFTIGDTYYCIEIDAKYRERHFFYKNSFLNSDIQVYANAQKSY